MKMIIIVAASLMSLNIFALSKEAKFTVSSITNSGRTFYTCHAVERMTEDFLEAMGATVDKLNCVGGLEPFLGGITTEARIRTTFDVAEGGEAIEVVLRGRDNCHLAQEVFRGLKKHFTITNRRGNRSCGFRSNGRWRMSFTVQ